MHGEYVYFIKNNCLFDKKYVIIKMYILCHADNKFENFEYWRIDASEIIFLVMR